MIFFPGGYSPGISTAIQDILLQSIRDLGRTGQGDLDEIKNVTGSYQGSVPPGSCRLRIAVRQPLTSKTSAPERRITVSEQRSEAILVFAQPPLYSVAGPARTYLIGHVETE